MANLMLVMARAMWKGTFNPGALTGLERFMLAQVRVPDRVPTMLAATNVEPALIDPKYNYQLLAKSVDANLELFTKVKERFAFDLVSVPTWLGLMLTGVAELGVQFEIPEERVPYAKSFPIQGIEDVQKIKPFTEPSGYFKMTLDINQEAQRRFSDTMVTFMTDGPWDLAMLFRGDKQLPMDFRPLQGLYRNGGPATPGKDQEARRSGTVRLPSWNSPPSFRSRIDIHACQAARA